MWQGLGIMALVKDMGKGHGTRVWDKGIWARHGAEHEAGNGTRAWKGHGIMDKGRR